MGSKQPAGCSWQPERCKRSPVVVHMVVLLQRDIHSVSMMLRATILYRCSDDYTNEAVFLYVELCKSFDNLTT
jgi:hypothetical protein